MADALTIRRATREDLPELVQLYRHLVPDEPVSPGHAHEIWKRFSHYGPSGIFLGLADGRQIATCTLVVVPNFVRGSPAGHFDQRPD